MGNFLTILQSQQVLSPQLSILRKYSLSNIQQSKDKFRSLCDTFAIDEIQFEQIFGQELQIFKMFDDDDNLLIDGLELFTGLILFTDNCKFEDKIKFIFNIYDFNDINSLSKTDLQFLFLSACSACNKIMGIKTKPKHDEIILLVNDLFPDKKRVNINEMLKWAMRSNQILKLFEIVEQKSKPLPEVEKIHQQKVYMKPKITQQEQNIYKEKKSEWLRNIISKSKDNDRYPSQIQHSDIKVEIEHVIGFRSRDIKQSLFHAVIDGKHHLLYSSACIIVIYLIGSSHQQFYAEHKNQVIAICIHDGIVASSEIGRFPSIHIWDLKTRKTLKVLSGSHRKGVHILKFIDDGKKLVACGLGQENSPIYIYNMSNYQLQKSISIQFPIVELAQVNQYKTIQDKTAKYIIGTSHSCFLLSGDKMQEIVMKRNTNFTCFQMIHLNSRRKYLKHYEQNDPGIRILLTGTEDGKFSAWDIDQQNKKLLEKKYDSEIIKIDYIKDYIVVATFSSAIDFFDYNLNLFHTIEITSFATKLFDYNVIDFISFDNFIIVSTGGGEVLRLQQIAHNKLEYKVDKIDNMISLKGEQSISVITKTSKSEILYTGGADGIITGIDLKTKKVVDTWILNQNITALDVLHFNCQNFLAAGTKLGMIYLRLNFMQIQKSFMFKKQISDLKFIVRENNQLYLIVAQTSGKIFIIENAMSNQSQRYQVSIENQIPISIHAQKERIIINTENNNLYVLSLVDKKHRQIKQNDKQATITSHIIKLSYNHKQLSKHDLVISPKIIAAARTQGGVCVWRNKESFDQNKRFVLNHHQSKVNSILLNKNLNNLITFGKKDNIIIIYKIMFSQVSSICSEELVIEKPFIEQDETIDKEIQYCIYKNNLINENKDQHLLVKGLKHSQLSTFLNSLSQKWAQTKFQPQKTCPPINIKLNHVYGLQSYDRRNNLICVENPKRYIYYVAKIIVVQNYKQNTQEFYLGHRFKVTAICLIDKNCVASGESSFLPNVHIWNYHTLQTVRIVQTDFKYGILSIVSSFESLIICGVQNKVEYDEQEMPTFGFSIINIQLGVIIAHRSQGLQKIYSVSANPLNADQFCSTGSNIVYFWQIKNRTIQKISQCFCDEQTITSSVYYHYMLNNTPKCDLIVGTKSGCIGVIVNKNKFIRLKQKGHAKFINCMKWIQLGGNTKNDIFVTASEDQTIKIWNKYFECIKEVKKTDDSRGDQSKSATIMERKVNEKLPSQPNISIQAISNWSQEKNQSVIEFLVSSRNGDIGSFYCDFGNAMEKDCKISICSKNHSSLINDKSNRRVFFAVHPKFDIVATVGQDCNLFIWDTEKSELIYSKYLGYSESPTCIQFNHGEGDILAIGFSDGLVYMYDSKILKPNMAKTQQKYLVSGLTELQKNKPEVKAAVLNIEFSYNGDFMAVSFDNCYSHSNNNIGSKTFQQSSHIVIYISLHASKLMKKQINQKMGEKSYTQFYKIPLESNTIFQTQSSNQYGKAAYYLTYLESYGETQKQNKTYLLICYQMFDSKQVRINYINETKYMLWDIDACSLVINHLSLNLTSSKKLNFPSILSCRYQLYQNYNQNQEGKNQHPSKLINTNLLNADMTSMITIGSRKSPNENMILGSLNGDIHIASMCSMSSFQKESDKQFLSKTIPAHSSFVDHIDTNFSEKFLFSSGLEDQVVLQWKIIHEPKVLPVRRQSTKFFKDQLKIQEMEYSVDQFKQRDQINFSKFPTIVNHQISPHRVIGRKIAGLRSKVFYNQDQQIIYSVGPNILVYDKSTINLKMITGSIHQSVDEISSMVMSENGRFCVTATAGTHASLMLWEINSQIMLDKIILHDIVHPSFIKLSSNNKRVLLYGLDQRNKGMVMLIDIESKKILGRMKAIYADSCTIRDGGFLKSSINKFVTCGSNHLTSWSYEGNEIVYENLEVHMDKQSSQQYAFLCYLAIQGKFITGCHNGFIHLWSEDGTFITKQAGHAELCENIISNGNHILSTGRDMRLIVWNIQSNRISKDNVFDLTTHFMREISQIYCVDDNYSLRKVKQFDQNDQVSSIFMKENKLILGTIFGSIYQLFFEESRLSQITTCTSILNIDNRKRVVGMFLTKDNKFLYYITNKGVLSIWEIDTFKCVEERHFDKQRQAIDMIMCENTNYYFVCFTTEIFVLEIDKPKIESIFISKKQIKAIAVKRRGNDPMIAVAEKQDDYIKISVYCYVHDKPSKTIQIHPQKNKFPYKHSISMSFSEKLDDLLITLDGKDIAIRWVFEHEKKQLLNNNLLIQKDQPRDIFKNSSKTEGIIEMYTNEKNPVLDIQQINSNLFLVGDTIGTLKLIDVKNEKEPKLIDYSLAHLNQISKIRVSQDRRTAATYSKVDEAIIVWRIDLL